MRVSVNGMIASDEDAGMIRYFGLDKVFHMVCPQDIRDAIANTPPGDTPTLEINSGGGSLYAGFEMYSLLVAAEVPTRAEVQSLAGSAASILLAGVQTACCTPVGQVMIHLPSTVTEGNEVAHRESLGMLQAATESIINAYAAKCGGRITRAALKAKMKAETFLTADEAKEIGLIDQIIGQNSPITPAQVMNCMGGGLMNGGLPDMDKLREAYAKAHTPTKPDEHTRAEAQLALELMRII